MVKTSDAMSRREADALLAHGLAKRIAAENDFPGFAPTCLDTLAEAVSVAQGYARTMIEALGEPVFLHNDLRSSDAFGPVSFGSTEETRVALRKAFRIKEFFTASPAPQCVFLMTMQRHEYEILGSELEGEMIKRGVLQTVVEFEEHHVPFVAPTLKELQGILIENVVLYLAGIVPGRVRASQSIQTELLRSEELLKARLHTLEHARMEHRPFAVPHELRTRIAQGEVELAELEKRLAGLHDKPNARDCLWEIQDILRAPHEHIRLEQVELRMGDFGIKSATGRPMRFLESCFGNGQRLTVLLSGMTRDIARQIWPDLA
jgi:hypothetical protein